MKNKKLIVWMSVVIILMTVGMLAASDRENWFDTSFSLETVHLMESQQIQWENYDVHPPGYYMTLYAWMKFQPQGIGEVMWAKMLSMVFGLLFLLFVMLGVKEVFGEYVSVLTGYFLAMCTTYLHFGTEIRAYMLLMMISAFAFWMFVKKGKKEPSSVSIYRLIGMVPLMLIAWVHYYGALAILFFSFFLFVRKERMNALMLFVGGMAITAIVFFTIALPQIQRSDAMWFQISSLQSFLSAISYTIYVPQSSLLNEAVRWLQWVFFGIFIAVCVWCVRTVWRGKISEEDKIILMMFLTFIFPFLALLASPSLSVLFGHGFWKNLYHHRLFLVVTWMFAVALFIQVARFIEKRFMEDRSVWIRVAIIVAIGMWLTVLNWNYMDTRHHELENTLAHIPCDGSTIVHESPFSGMPAIVFERERGCTTNRHVVVTGITKRQSNTAGFDAWDPDNVYWEYAVPDEKEFLYVHAEGIESIQDMPYEVVYQDDGIDLRKVYRE